MDDGEDVDRRSETKPMTDPRELSLVADELPVAIWMGRVPSGELVYMNAACREMLGLDEAPSALRGGFVEPYGVHLPTGEPYPEDKMPFERVIAARTTVVLEDLVIHRRDGKKVNLRVFAKPIFDEAGTMTHVLEAFTDMTREVEAERARVDGERRLARAQRLESIGQLVAGIAHDFNNLLTVTKLSVTWLRSGEPSHARQQALAQIDAVTDSAIELIKNLIGFARRERRLMVPTSVETVAANVVEMARRTFDPAIEVHAELAADNATVLGDASQLEQLVMNLVLNARDAIRSAGKVVVRTSLATVDEGAGGAIPAGRWLVLEVVDDGCGIDPEIRDRIFEPYFTTKTQGSVKGTGLGLATVHGIVNAHCGVVEVADAAGGGTVVRVALPQPMSATRAVVRTSPPPPSPPRKASEDRLVLVIDDEPLVRASTVATLRELGLRVCDAPDGATGIDIFSLRHEEVAGVVLDMVMPGLRGREVFVELRKLRPDVPVLLVTGSGDTAEVDEIRALGVAGVLAKPYDDRQLATALEQAGVL
ncbi:MAG: response regulator [Labilithrix sp.]|nr:response regulator [Labilithrix sp.]